MKTEMHLLDVRLNLFDGAAAGTGDGAGTAGQAGDGTMGESQALPGPTRRGKQSGEFQNVLFGKQESAAAGVDSEGGTILQQQRDLTMEKIFMLP